ncbi:hypothetical protein [Thalassospira profundimaris]|uniref:hypothetical protein n=1 Tax=Thalassospira profundimaris TaxID=502049 RepID=UPI0015EFDE62|nr:hypothetical protein [Thalassospira profundimaris]
MNTTRKLMMTAAIIATTLGVVPAVSALAQTRPDEMRRDFRDGVPGDCQGGKFHHGGYDRQKGPDGRPGPKQAMRMRNTPLTTDEARLLVDAMLLRHGNIDLKTGVAKTSQNGREITLPLLNANGDLVENITMDAYSGHPARKEFRELRRMIGKPDRQDRFDRKYNAAQMNTLVQATIIMRGNGNLTLNKLTQTDRGTYMATITNKKGDIVREVELSSVTARPIDGGPIFGPGFGPGTGPQNAPRQGPAAGPNPM